MPRHSPIDTKLQVIGDMWESYLRMLDDGMSDGYELLVHNHRVPFTKS